MALPETGLPNRATVIRAAEAGEDSNGNVQFVSTELTIDRPARLYRDNAVENRYVREGIRVSGMVAMRFHDGDDFTEKDRIVVDGRTFDVVYARRMDTWSRPSHWEIVVGNVR